MSWHLILLRGLVNGKSRIGSICWEADPNKSITCSVFLKSLFIWEILSLDTAKPVVYVVPCMEHWLYKLDCSYFPLPADRSLSIYLDFKFLLLKILFVLPRSFIMVSEDESNFFSILLSASSETLSYLNLCLRIFFRFLLIRIISIT